MIINHDINGKKMQGIQVRDTGVAAERQGRLVQDTHSSGLTEGLDRDASRRQPMPYDKFLAKRKNQK